MTNKNSAEISMDKSSYDHSSTYSHKKIPEKTVKAEHAYRHASEHAYEHTPEHTPTYTQTPQLLNRSEAAAALGISKSELIRREELQLCVPTSVDAKGWHFYSLEYLSTLPGYASENVKGQKPRGVRTSAPIRAAQFKEAFSRRSTPSNYDPKIAAQIFDELDHGMSSREIVKKLLIHPHVMRAVYDDWKELATLDGGGIVITASTLEAINKLPLPGTFPITTEEQLLTNLREASKDTPMCPSCTKRPSRICMSCSCEEAQEAVSLAAKTRRAGAKPSKAF